MTVLSITFFDLRACSTKSGNGRSWASRNAFMVTLSRTGGESDIEVT
jgi:hypothetical protein